MFIPACTVLLHGRLTGGITTPLVQFAFGVVCGLLPVPDLSQQHGVACGHVGEPIGSWVLKVHDEHAVVVVAVVALALAAQHRASHAVALGQDECTVSWPGGWSTFMPW